MQNTLPPSSRSIRTRLRTLFTFIVGTYIVGVVVYFILRLLLGDRFWPLSLVNTFAYMLFCPLLILLPLALIFRMRLNALRLVPLVLVGGLWFAPYYLPKTPEPASGETLRVFTFNVWRGNVSVPESAAWIENQQFDIVFLQEVIPFHEEKTFRALAEQLPHHVAQQDGFRWSGAPNANITYSRYPILEAKTVDLQTPDTANPIRVVLDVNGQRIAVYNLHLAWPGGNSRIQIPGWINNFFLGVLLGFNDRVRNNQIAHLIEHLKAEPYPYIVAGDFNTSDQSPTYNAMADIMRDSFREAGQGWGGSWPVSSTRGLPAFLPPVIRIDYIWHSDSLRTIEAQQAPPLGSDHLALLATLALPPQP
jgi:vancomycin resistance protein VanJ